MKEQRPAGDWDTNQMCQLLQDNWAHFVSQHSVRRSEKDLHSTHLQAFPMLCPVTAVPHPPAKWTHLIMSSHTLSLSDIRKDYNLGPNFDLLNVRDTAKSLPCAVLKGCGPQTRNELDTKQLSRVNYCLKWWSELIISVGKNIPMCMRKARQMEQTVNIAAYLPTRLLQSKWNI